MKVYFHCNAKSVKGQGKSLKFCHCTFKILSVNMPGASMFTVIAKPNGDQMDEAMAHYAMWKVRANFQPQREKIKIEEMLTMWLSIGMDINDLEETPYCVRSVDGPGFLIVYHFCETVPFPASLTAVNFDLLEIRDDNRLQEDIILKLYKCSVFYVLKR
jgi:hypothetical protein